METAMVAVFYKVDPDVIDYEWSYLDWLKRKEYMFIHNEIERRFNPKETTDAG